MKNQKSAYWIFLSKFRAISRAERIEHTWNSRSCNIEMIRGQHFWKRTTISVPFMLLRASKHRETTVRKPFSGMFVDWDQIIFGSKKREKTLRIITKWSTNLILPLIDHVDCPSSGLVRISRHFSWNQGMNWQQTDRWEKKMEIQVKK